MFTIENITAPEHEKKIRHRKKKVFSVKEAQKKAVAELLVLYLLQERPMYTYEITQMIQERSGGVLLFDTLYQSIYRLKDLGYITEKETVLSDDNRVRVYFTTTPAGLENLPKMMEEFYKTTDAIRDILGEASL